ncbi:MAG: hypothetical protein ACM3ML_11825 [Micromonosporaceae bacterium]
MIVISAAGVGLALVLLVAGVITSSLTFVYVSIGVSVAATLLLAAGVFMRRDMFMASARGAPGSREYGGAPREEPRPSGLAAPTPREAAEPARSQTAPAEAVAAGSAMAGAGARDRGRLRPAAAASATPESALVFVIPGRRRFHVQGCDRLVGRLTEELTLNEALEEGFSACTACVPVSAPMADRQVAGPSRPPRQEPRRAEAARPEPARWEPFPGPGAGARPSGGARPVAGPPAAGPPGGEAPETKPVEIKPEAAGEQADAQPAEAQSADVPPAEGEFTGDRPTGGEPADGEPAGARPAGGEQGAGEPADSHLTDSEPAGGEPDDSDDLPSDTGDPASTVWVVRGVSRYHLSDCVLIHVVDDDDVDTMTLAEAAANDCSPCRACHTD